MMILQLKHGNKFPYDVLLQNVQEPEHYPLLLFHMVYVGAAQWEQVKGKNTLCLSDVPK